MAVIVILQRSNLIRLVIKNGGGHLFKFSEDIKCPDHALMQGVPISVQPCQKYLKSEYKHEQINSTLYQLSFQGYLNKNNIIRNGGVAPLLGPRGPIQITFDSLLSSATKISTNA